MFQHPLKSMPRSRDSVKLSMDDLRRFIAGENGEVQVKMIDWAKGELERRRRAGVMGGRPIATESSHKIKSGDGREIVPIDET